jgi:Fungal family of unknown function (DUF1776)
MANMTLAGVIVFPGCSGYPEGSLAFVPPPDVVDTLNTRLISPILTIQQFLPLLANHSTNPKEPSSIVIAYPSISQSLSPPNQMPESIITSSLSALAASLRREVVSMANITVHELKLGNFDLGSVPGGRTPTQSAYLHLQRQETSKSALTHWHSSQRAAIQRTFLSQRSLIKGSAARELHNAVFDALAPPQSFKAFGKYEWQVAKRHSTTFVGSGARLYDIVGKVVPSSIIGFVLGYKSKQNQRQPERITSVNHPTSTMSHSISSDSALWEKI